jgi:hypothetical protein
MGSVAGHAPTARARESGVEMKSHRKGAGYTGPDLARRIGWSPSKVPRMESGTRNASEVDVAIYLTSCGVRKVKLKPCSTWPGSPRICMAQEQLQRGW